MSSRTDKYLGILVVFAVLMANTAIPFAKADFEDTQTVKESKTTEQENFSPSAPDENEKFLTRLKQELNLSKTEYRQLMNTVSDTNSKLGELSKNKMTLSNQIAILDKSIATTEAKSVGALKSILEMENEITLLYEKIETKKVAIEYQKELLKNYIRVIYEEENNYFSHDKDGEIQAFKLLLADKTVGENLKELEYFDILNEAGQQIIEQLSSLSDELLVHQKELKNKKSKLQALHKELESEKQQLELQKESKQNLLTLTKGQEKIYQQLLDQSMRQQEELLNDVKNLDNAVQFIEKKMKEQGADFNPNDYLSLLDYKTQVLYDYRYRSGPLNEDGFDWPVSPDRGISAYFHDPTYVGAFGVQHNAIDIPVYQGTPVRASAEGVVYTTKDNGYGYSYIILAHSGGYMTVYGHVSSILVKEGDLVNQGAVIALSGGMPGTKGAGYMTTGPHLHFEVLSNGLYVDPLSYLPLDTLTEDQLYSSLPEKYYDDWEKAVAEKNFKAIERF